MPDMESFALVEQAEKLVPATGGPDGHCATQSEEAPKRAGSRPLRRLLSPNRCPMENRDLAAKIARNCRMISGGNRTDGSRKKFVPMRRGGECASLEKLAKDRARSRARGGGAPIDRSSIVGINSSSPRRDRFDACAARPLPGRASRRRTVVHRRLRIVTVTCARCGESRAVYFQIIESSSTDQACASSRAEVPQDPPCGSRRRITVAKVVECAYLVQCGWTSAELGNWFKDRREPPLFESMKSRHSTSRALLVSTTFLALCISCGGASDERAPVRPIPIPREGDERRPRGTANALALHRFGVGRDPLACKTPAEGCACSPGDEPVACQLELIDVRRSRRLVYNRHAMHERPVDAAGTRRVRRRASRRIPLPESCTPGGRVPTPNPM